MFVSQAKIELCLTTTNMNLTSSVSQFAADGKEKYTKTCIAWGDLNLKTLLLLFETIRVCTQICAGNTQYKYMQLDLGSVIGLKR